MRRLDQTEASINALLGRINFNFFGHDFMWVVQPKGDGFLIQVGTYMTCVETGEESHQKGGKHYISKYATDSEVIFKGFKACKDFVMHELHESFYVDDVRLFDPHLDLDALVDSVKYMKRTSRDGSWYPPRIMENV